MIIIKIVKNLCLLLCSLILIVAAGELYLMETGHKLPRHYRFSTTHIDDNECGWLPTPGNFHSRENDEASITILDNNCRISLSREAAQRNYEAEQDPQKDAPLPAVVLGCSYTFGMGVSNKDTFCWKLNDDQQRFYFTNCGVIGYNTYQCLKRLEKFFAAGEKPRLVIYAFINDHLMRNVSCRIFGKAFETFDFIETPYFELLPSDNFVFHPLRHLCWPGEKYLYTVNLANRLYVNRLIDKSRRVNFNKEAAHAVYRHLIREMDQLCKRNGAVLVVASLDTSSNWITAAPNKYDTVLKEQYPQSSAEQSDAPIRFVDINCENLYLPEYHVMNRLDFHPAPIAHKFWADKINHYLQNTDLNLQ
ncbi:MAG: hypothetical protein ACI38Q_08635 [Candidatus Bruticola sp.]